MSKLNGAIKSGFFGKKASQRFFRRLLSIALEGLNLSTGGGDLGKNGEAWALKHALQDKKAPVVFDVGAQGGDYTREALRVAPDARIFAFEPCQRDYEPLEKEFVGKVSVEKIAFGDKDGSATLRYPADRRGMSSLYDRGLGAATISEEVTVRTIDSFCKERGIGHIDLLKLDVEGHELACLRGAEGMLPNIHAIQFEMGAASRDARVYFRDIFELLSDYKISRILRDGLEEVTAADKTAEFLFTANYLAERKG